MRAILVCALLVGCGGGAATSGSFHRDHELWRAKRVERLTSEGGWLSLVGLDWLGEGDNRFGADPENQVVLPLGTPIAGTFVVSAGTVRLVPQAPMAVNGKELTGPVDVASDEKGDPDRITIGDHVMTIIKRGDRLGVRTRNPKALARTNFHGLDAYPPDEKYRVVATLVPTTPPRILEVPTVLGTVEPMPSPGELHFTLDGKPLVLIPVEETPGDKELFVIFRDATADDATYQAGRFVYTQPTAEPGKVILDFNRAYNPPCAFTDFATCPLPPKENVLPVRIEAGEKRYGGGHAP